MTNQNVIILGSSRRNGDAEKLAIQVSKLLDCEIINLNDYKISYYDYEHQNQDDDFIPLMKLLTEKYDTFIFITPVYWYSMSGIMKVFFDRLTDLLTIEKETGRKLKGKNMAVLSTSTGDNLGDKFWLPFSATAKYLNMNYIAGMHTILEETSKKAIESFAEQLNNYSS